VGIWKNALTLAAMSMALAANVAQAENKKIALVVKSLGNPFFDAAHKGADEAAKELGGVDVIYTGPTDTKPEGQIELINSLIAQNVSAIAISANDRDALVPVLKKAAQRGITVISWDSGVAPAGRLMHLNPSSNELIGNICVKMAADSLPQGGDVAILSASATATNQNAWIAEMKKALPKYKGINIVATAYGDDKSDKSYTETQGLIKSYPNLKAIISPTSVGIVAAAQAVEDAKMVGKINVTGLGLPSAMAAHVKAGSSKSFAVWNPIDLGYSAIMITYNLMTGKAKAEPGAEIGMGRMGKVKLDANREGAMAEPFVHDANNVDKYAKLF
jgi:rhamnose transport system substrate-binding protein